jgi:putative mRNA 3-end processing factor
VRELIEVRSEGLYCPPGDFYIDPRKPVARAVITHAHGDHARPGCGRYWSARQGAGLLRERLGRGATIESPAYGERFRLGGAQVSLHPAGHVLGSSQVRIDTSSEQGDGQVWVVSGDYKREADPSCAPFEVVPCDCFVTEATFASPVYRWPPPQAVAREIHDWWQQCKSAGLAAVLFCYALGKAQRILAELAAFTDETVYLHSAMRAPTRAYRQAGVRMLPTLGASDQPRSFDWKGRLVLAPPGASGTPWVRRFGVHSRGFASGWMSPGGERGRQTYDRGFVLSDHADWLSLLRTIQETGARRVLATHGHSDSLIAVLREQGIEASSLSTQYEGQAAPT